MKINRCDRTEVAGLIGQIRNIKHKAIISLIYSGGLRVGELINLKIEDIDSKRMVINIRNTKGNKDRQVPLSNNVLKLLRRYYLRHKPREYLFNGQFDLKYSRGSIGSILKKAASSAGIKKHVMTHTLRHSYATHMLEAGIDLRYIKELLGHNSFKSTMIYTHISRKKFQKLGSPIDDMKIN